MRNINMNLGSVSFEGEYSLMRGRGRNIIYFGVV